MLIGYKVRLKQTAMFQPQAMWIYAPPPVLLQKHISIDVSKSVSQGKSL